MSCPHLSNKTCGVLSTLVGDVVTFDTNACKICEIQPQPRSVNKVTIDLAVYELRKQKDYDKAIKVYEDYHGKKITFIENETGPGTELAKLVSWFKFNNKKCNCAQRIRKMNKWGPDECERRRPTIIRWLRHSAYLNGIPFNSKVVDVLLNRAIKNARSKLGSSGSDST